MAVRYGVGTAADFLNGTLLQNATLIPTREEREMTEVIKKLKPGLLVSLKTHTKGNRSYTKQELERAHVTDGGVERSRWNTTKIVFSPEEAKEASTVASRARYLITRLCADTAHGPLCPSERRAELYEAIKEARALVDEFNTKAVFSRIEVNVICGEVVADDIEAARALFSETEQLMTQMQEALAELDTKKIQQLCAKALNMGQMLSPEANANIVAAVNVARAARKKIVAAGEQAAIQIDRRAIELIGVARSSFLDFGEVSEVEIVAEHNGRAIDFDPEQHYDSSEDEPVATDADYYGTDVTGEVNGTNYGTPVPDMDFEDVS